MAKRKRRKATRKTSRKSLSATPRRRRRKRLGAGAGAFKMLSNPMVGGAVGGVLSYIGSRIGANLMKNKTTGEPSLIGALIVPGIGIFISGKKYPFVTAGIVSGTAMSMTDVIVKKLPATSFVHKLLGDDASFVNDNLLNAGAPIMLSAEGDTILPYQLKDMILSEMEEMEEMEEGGMDEPFYHMNDMEEMDEMDEDN